jgi:hypothetical protein
MVSTHPVRKRQPRMISDNIVIRALYLFDSDALTLDMIAARAGVTTNTLIRGIVRIQLDAWRRMDGDGKSELDVLQNVILQGN